MTTEVAGAPQTNGILDDAEVPKREIKNHILFEISTEAAHRGKPFPHIFEHVGSADSCPVGGIYSVIKSKASVTTAEYGDRFTLIGPLNRASVCRSRGTGPK